ncbi:hypothetical protein GGTG_10761 [Gaeumannomyces tritici R3-111a-1]|uniref:Major facilitator superfamily (MFS) profile domain-containing protein n=1 Tax=Gaeumannomyces tritici (strain R3-111a-1) TaxID=644352 RepID=J3PB88_GAET3|nr:hypothetical protein GGTG_10761 [Gaeumannomyces tritici R3-111a-1]EJT71504.1 hypothetical protein GGTG_10761 [Gaeumannomyces tritici R3-111a-1]
MASNNTQLDTHAKGELQASSPPSSPPPRDDYLHGPKLFAVIFALLLGMFLARIPYEPRGSKVALDLTIVATAVPSITAEFRSFEDIGWYAAAFFITLAAFQSLWGRAYKHFDLKLVFLTTVLLFELGSLICGVAPTSLTLIVGRAVAGLGGAGVTGGIYTIVAFIVPPAKVPTYIGFVGAVFSVASVAGPLLGGVFSGEVTWRWAFYINLPVGAISVILLVVFFHTPAAVKPVPIDPLGLLLSLDVLGIVLSLAFSTCFTIGMQLGGVAEPWSSPKVVGMLVASAVLAIAFCLDQWLCGERSLIVPRLIKQRTIAALCLFIFFLNATNLSILYSLPQYFQVINGVSPTMSGIRNLPMIFTTALGSMLSGTLLGRHGRHQLFLVSGAALLILGTGLIYTLNQGSSLGQIIGYQIIVGFGIGWCVQVPVTVAQGLVQPQDVAVVTALVLFFQLVTGAIGVASAQAVLANRLVAALTQLAPGLEPHKVLAVGAHEIRLVFQGADLDNVLRAYMTGLQDSWAMSVGLSGLTVLSTFLGDWKNLKSARANPVDSSSLESEDRKGSA